MKKTFILLMFAAAFVMMGCDNTQKSNNANLTAVEEVVTFKGCDMAAFDNGKVTFYNSSTDKFVPFADEKDNVISGIFYDENVFYYTVSVNDELYLKKIDFSAEKPAPVQLADWGLKLSDCVVDSCEKCASMVFYSDVQFVGIEYNMGEMCKGFQDEKYYLIDEQTVSDGWPEGVDDGFLAMQAFIDGVHSISWPKEEGSDEMNFYYVPNQLGMYSSEEELAADWVCISDQIDFHEGKYEGWDVEPEFEMLGCSPDGKCVAYAAIMETGRGGRGPLCFATIDGKVQKLLAYDPSYGWLDDGRLAFSDEEGIKTVTPDGTITKLCSGSRVVTVFGE